MLDENDIQKLIQAQKEIFVTKEYLEGLIDILATKQEVSEIGKDVKYIKDELIGVDAIVKRVDYIENVLAIKK